MDMLIVESGAKSKTIQKYLGKGWIVGACNGHVQDLPTSRDTKDGKKAMWASTADKLPQPPWEWTDEKAERLIGKLLDKGKSSKVENVYIATDLDREGEFIAWRLFEIFSSNGFNSIWRIKFNEITKSAVQAAIDARGAVNQNLVDAAMVRRFMDRLVGFRSSKFSRSWSLPAMGRVQTPTLGFIVDKELEREAFIPQPYFAVHADAGGLRWDARFHDKDDSNAWVDDKGKFHAGRTNDADLANGAFVAVSDGLTISTVDQGKYQRNPKPPFTTDKLIMTAGSEMNWNPRRTMKVAGELYNAGHITYIRTDSTRTNAGAREDIKAHIRETWGEDHIGKGVGESDAKGDSNVQDAHEAIRPTRPKTNSPDELTTDQARLYRLVWARFAGSQMNESRYERLSMTAEATGFSRPFAGTASWRVHRGWEAAFEGIRKEPPLSPPSFEAKPGTALLLDSVDEGEDNPSLREDETKPPSRYKQHSIVQKMKGEGIGRPSTFATTIGKLLDRKYVIEENGSLLPSDAGRTLWLDVAPYYDRSSHGIDGHLFGTNFTSEMEANLDEIESGESAAPTVWHTFSAHFQALHLAALDKKKLTPTPKQLSYFTQITQKLSDEEIAKFTGGKAPDEMTGGEMRDVIDVLIKAHPVETQPASKKQLNWIIALAKSAELSEVDACNLVEVKAFDELTGSRKGSASKLIEILLTKSKDAPREASQKQLDWIKKLVTKAELNEADACALVDTSVYGDLQGGVGGTASKLITILSKRTGTTGRKRKSKKSPKGKKE